MAFIYFILSTYYIIGDTDGLPVLGDGAVSNGGHFNWRHVLAVLHLKLSGSYFYIDDGRPHVRAVLMMLGADEDDANRLIEFACRLGDEQSRKLLATMYAMQADDDGDQRLAA